MAFQSNVTRLLRSGVVGEIFDISPMIVDTYILDANSKTISIGSAFTIQTDEAQVEPGGTGVFAGILVNPKAAANANDLVASNDVADGSVGELMKQGRLYANVGGVAVVGTGVYFVQATGVLGAGTAGAGQTQIVGAQVVLQDIAADGFGIIELNNQKA